MIIIILFFYFFNCRGTGAREDFYFRLNVITIELPPLRQRREDIPLLADFFIKKFSRRENKPIESISKDALNLLVRYFYPGNIKELGNIIERAIILTHGSVLAPLDLPLFTRGQAGDIDGMGNDEEELTLPEILDIT